MGWWGKGGEGGKALHDAIPLNVFKEILLADISNIDNFTVYPIIQHDVRSTLCCSSGVQFLTDTILEVHGGLWRAQHVQDRESRNGDKPAQHGYSWKAHT